MRQQLAVIAAVFGVLAAGAQAQQRQEAPPAHRGQVQPLAGVPLGQADVQFMLEAARMGHAEVRAGQLAMARSADPDVRAYGQQLVQDHQAANARLRQLAEARGVALPPLPSRQQRFEIDGLQGLSGPDFDFHFLRSMGLEAHQQAIVLFQGPATAPGRDPTVQAFARDVLPQLRQHLARAQALYAQALAARDTPAVVAETPLQGQPLAHPESGPAREAAQARVREAVQVVQRMKADPKLARLLERANGVFILPDYRRAALGAGAQAGQGVLVTRGNDDEFGNPVFYTMGGISVGAQAGVAGGEMAFLLMTERAVQVFRSDRNFSLTLGTGLAIGPYSVRDQASTGKVQDIVVWSGTSGAYAGLTVGVNNVQVDDEANRAYYGRPDATPLQILAGRIENPHNNVLGTVLGI